jgi:hypothetical protein
LVVTLSSNDTTEATVPATVTIPDGQASVTFPITSVDDTLPDGPQTVSITASVVDYFSVAASIRVDDDDFPKILSITPADNATGVDVSANIVVRFDQTIRKGNGLIYLVRSEDSKAGISIDVNSSQVTISGDTMTINPSIDLQRLKDYSIRIDRGSVLSTLPTVSIGTTLLTQDFELVPLSPAILELNGLTANGRDFSATPPQGWAVDNSSMARGGAPEWTGWTFAAASFWQTQGGQNRSNFARGTGTVAIADTDEWQDYSRESDSFNSRMTTTTVDLDSVQPNSVVLEFDSSFRPESGASFTPHVPTNMQGLLDVSYDNGTTWTNLLTLDTSNTLGTATAPNVNERRTISVSNPDTGLMKFRFTNTGTNDWWWAIDNVLITGTTVGLSFPGLTDPTAANFSTADAATLSITLPAAIGENAGTATGTVSRNLGTTGDVVVTLASSNTGYATVPATVTIPNGQASASFVITVLDNTVFNSTRPLRITGTATGFVGGEGSTTITDNETGEVIITEIMYDPAGAEQSTEWVEILNRGTTTADLSGWRLDDEDKQDWGLVPSGTTLAPGQIGVFYNRFFGLISEATFKADWGVPDSARLIGVDWSTEDDGSNKSRGGLFNAPSATEEILTILNGAGAVLNTVNFEEDGTVWPAYNNGSSIYLKDPATNNALGPNWGSARIGLDGGRAPTGTTYSTSDIGSPGRILRNVAPVLTVANAAITGNEGTTISNNGTWSDADVADVVTLSASSGTVIKNANGTWTWSLAATDNVPATAVTITATDDKGASTSIGFTYTINNVAPTITVASGTVSGAVLAALTNNGTWSDVAADTVTLTASVGAVTRNANGTWTWTLTPAAAVNNQTVTITATDEDGGSSNVTFVINAAVTVTNAKVYYLGSSFADSGVDSALDTGKSLAKAGTTARTLTFENLINTTRGLNGLVFDVAGLVAASLSASDFTFRVSPTGNFDEAANPPNSWTIAPNPSSIQVTPGTSTTAARVRLEWPNGAIANRWLQISLLANASTGLPSRQTYYIGHLLGETTGTLTDGVYIVQVADITLIRPSVGSLANVASVVDVDKSGIVQVADITSFRSQVGLLSLRNITIPADTGSRGDGSGFGGLSYSDDGDNPKDPLSSSNGSGSGTGKLLNSLFEPSTSFEGTSAPMPQVIYGPLELFSVSSLADKRPSSENRGTLQSARHRDEFSQLPLLVGVNSSSSAASVDSKSALAIGSRLGTDRKNTKLQRSIDQSNVDRVFVDLGSDSSGYW